MLDEAAKRLVIRLILETKSNYSSESLFSFTNNDSKTLLGRLQVAGAERDLELLESAWDALERYMESNRPKDQALWYCIAHHLEKAEDFEKLYRRPLSPSIANDEFYSYAETFLRDEDKIKIINKFLSETARDVSYDRLRFDHVIRVCNVSTKSRWELFAKFYTRNFYELISTQETIKHMDARCLADAKIKFESAADEVSNSQRLETFQSAKLLLRRIRYKSREVLSLIAKCDYQLGNFERSYNQYSVLTRALKNSQDALKFQNDRKEVLDSFVHSGQYLAYHKNQNQQITFFTRAAQTIKPIIKNAELGSVPGQYVLYASALTLELLIGIPLLPLGLGMILIGATLMSLVGLCETITKAATRSPLDEERQLNMINNVLSFNVRGDDTKQNCIRNILMNYSDDQSSDRKTRALMTDLKDSQLSTKRKWQSLELYLFERKENSILCNNGKKLYQVIDTELETAQQNFSPALVL